VRVGLCDCGFEQASEFFARTTLPGKTVQV
jgi:hypothetical protein